MPQKKFIIAIILLLSLTCNSQGHFGLSASLNNYITDTPMLLFKSANGFTLGLVSKYDLNEDFEILSGIYYNRFNTTFIGKADVYSKAEDLKFNMDQLSIPISLNFNYFSYYDFRLGIITGPSFNFGYGYQYEDDSKSDYILEPLGIPIYEMRFENYNDTLFVNVFWSLGLTAQYTEHLMLDFKYFYGLTDPYRQTHIDSEFTEGKDSYFSFGLTGFF